jgi:hypothetical protein
VLPRSYTVHLVRIAQELRIPELIIMAPRTRPASSGRKLLLATSKTKANVSLQRKVKVVTEQNVM